LVAAVGIFYVITNYEYQETFMRIDRWSGDISVYRSLEEEGEKEWITLNEVDAWKADIAAQEKVQREADIAAHEKAQREADTAAHEEAQREADIAAQKVGTRWMFRSEETSKPSE